MSDLTLCVETVWNIENFSYCWHETKNVISSPDICVPCFKGTKFCLMLGPRGWYSTNHVSLFLKITELSSSLEDAEIVFDVAIMDSENTLQNVQRFHKSSLERCFGTNYFIERCFLEERKKLYLSGDVLRVVCKIWLRGVTSSESSRYHLRTRIPVNKCSFSWRVNETLGLGSTSKICFALPFPPGKIASIDLEQVFNQNKKHVDVTIDGDFKKKCSWKCEIRAYGTEEEFLVCGDIVDPNSLPYRRSFEPLLFSQNISDESQSGKPNDIDSDSLNNVLDSYNKADNVAIHSGIELVGVFFIVLHELISCCESTIVYNPEILKGSEFGSSYMSKSLAIGKNRDHSLQQDLYNGYFNNLLCDFKVKVLHKSYNVHSFILAARSPVLNHMLVSNMKESINKTLELDDLDESTVAQMLDYLYTDDTGELCYENAVKLYYAGDKYEIQSLKEKVSSFLVSSISCNNVCDILELADRHQDEHLKSAVVKYVCKHEKEMMTSDKFRILSQRNP